MVVLVSCKNEEDPIKMKALECSHQFFRRSRTDNSGVGSCIWPNFKSYNLLCIYSSPARIKMIQSKMKEQESSQHFSHYKSMLFFQMLKGS